jgi:cobalt-zinc-cadmium efflux system outer membrane protein
MDYNQIIRSTWRLFVQLLAGQERITLLEKSHQELQRIKEIITGRADAGAASPYDVLRIEQESQALATRLENAHTDMVSTTGELSVLLGLPNWRPQVSGTLSPLGTPADLNKLWQLAEEHNPAIETAYRETIAADANIEKAKTERFPVPALQVGTAYTDKPYGLATYVGVAVDVPLFDRGQGGMARAEAGKHTAILNRELLLASTRQELERAVEVLKRRRETLATFEKQVVTPLATIQQMSEDSYRFGKTSLLELLDASRSRTEIKMNHVDLLVGEMEAELDAMMVAGTLADKAKK